MSACSYCRRALVYVALPVLMVASPLSAQNQFVHNDRDRDSVYRSRDVNHNGLIEDSEIFLFFSSANAAGTIGPMNPNAIVASVCRTVAVGDQVNRNVVTLRDVNGDGDAEDLGESMVFADAANLSGVSLAFPTGAAFDSSCRLYVTNAGNAFGNDGIYRLVDNNADGDAQDAGEITQYVGDAPGGFGPGNGPYSPQEIFFDELDVGYLRNSSANLHGVWRFEDINNNGRADDSDVDPRGTDEFTVYFDASNASGLATAAGFAIDPDRFRPGSMYFLQTITGPIRQLIRLTDANSDRDAQDAGEAVIVWAAATPNAIDVISMNSGDVLLDETASGFIHRLHDGNGDGDFMDVGEISLMLANGAGTLLDVRQIARLCRPGDTNCDGSIDADDLVGVILQWGPGGCAGVDTDCNGSVDADDLVKVILEWGT